jgi:DNA (cytosine-5)-methyltransferase 1
VAQVPAADDEWASGWHRFLTTSERVTYESGVSLRLLDLFSGVGGLALGFEKAAADRGMSVDSIGAVDLDGRALRVYAANHQTHRPRESSVAAVVDFQVRGEGVGARFLYEPELIGPAADEFHGLVDVVLAGPPCQGHSSLNNSTRGDDPRNRLYLTVPAVAAAVGASTVLIENVPGVARSKGNVVDTAIQLLESSGYSITSGTLAADALGWPQTRKRYFVVACRGANPVPLADISDRFRREPLPVAWAIGDLLDRVAEPGDPMDGVAEMSAENVDRIAWLFDNDAYDTPNHLRPDCHKKGTSYGAVYGRMWWDRPAPTLTTGFLTAGRGRFIHPKRQRTLTPREAARIQGFPDWFDFCVDGRAEVPKKRELAKWIGNAVPSILGHAAAQSAFGC